ncbi:MAG: pilus assembly protein [Pseudomonadota bacterium]
MFEFLLPFCTLFKEFHKKTIGNISLLFAISTIPLIGTIGIALDFGSSYRASSKMQNALDNAILITAAALKDGKTKNEAKQDAAKFMAQHASADYPNYTHNITLTQNNTKITGTASANLDTILLGVFGIKQLQVNVKSDAVLGTAANLEIALVLDTTASMHGDKIVALQNATKHFVNEMIPGTPNSNVKIALVPFNRHINIGENNRYEEGIFVPNDFQTTENECRVEYEINNQCTEQIAKTWFCENTSASNVCHSYETVCTGEGNQINVCTPRNKNVFWTGCVAFRPNQLNIVDDKYSEYPVQAVMDSNYGRCIASPIVRLTDNKEEIFNISDNLVAEGTTYIPGGLVWGWRLLSDAKPFSDGAPKSASVQKSIVLMSDGANESKILPRSDSATQFNINQEIYSPIDGSTNFTDTNNDTAALCQNIKDDDVRIDTISFDFNDQDAINMLKACAGNGGTHYHVSKIEDLVPTFDAISSSFGSIRLTE